MDGPVFESLLDINISSNKWTPEPLVTVTSGDAKDCNNVMDNNEHAIIQSSLITHHCKADQDAE